MHSETGFWTKWTSLHGKVACELSKHLYGGTLQREIGTGISETSKGVLIFLYIFLDSSKRVSIFDRETGPSLRCLDILRSGSLYFDLSLIICSASPAPRQRASFTGFRCF